MKELITPDLLAPASLYPALLAQLKAAPAQELTQLSLPVASADLLAWLDAQTQMPKAFWTSRKSAARVAVAGAVASWNTLAELEAEMAGWPEADAGLRCYGGWRFDRRGPIRAPWQAWPRENFFLPRWELRAENGQTRLLLNLKGSPAAQAAQLEQALKSLAAPAKLPAAWPRLGTLHHQPDASGWRHQLEGAQALFAAGKLQKLVLSRISTTALAELPLSLMRALLTQGREAYHFWFQPMAGQILWGASPERLYARQGRELATEALAGTRQRSDDPFQQARLQAELMASHKEQEENERVLQHLLAALKPLSRQLAAEPLRVIPSGPVQHLYRCVQAQLSTGITDSQLIAALHPTPAVSGFPSAQALAALRQIETHDRGWYTGALGWVSPQAAEWSVILRCALWQSEGITFYTGAGIMPESEADAEWRELNLKLSSLLALWPD